MKYSKKFKLKLICRFKAKESSIGDMAHRENIPKQTLARWIRNYKRFGEKGLENRKSGTKERPINEGFENLVLDRWKKKKRSVYMMRRDLRKDIKRNGHNVSERQIKRIYKKHKLQPNSF